MTRTHLVTGAGSGIGEALAERLHARGDDLLLVARSQERAQELARRWPGSRTLVADLAAPGDLAGVAGDLPDRLDSVVHSAGVVALGTVAESDQADWERQLTVNLLAPVALTRLCLPALRAARGTVVLVSSGQGLAASASWGGYAASKHALRAFADSLRAEEAPAGVRVTSVYPGRTATPMQEAVHAHEGRDYDADRWIRPGTVADAVLHVLDLPGDATVPDLPVRPRG
ncbi:SDR family oxidoreductase [Nocardioides sp. GY 10127]|uniref:SDR family oxidoreductase n=1 Tax=Nocardioides sp. GY 10127 TaxID=2569762 RepID=UPI0010A7AC00|nr:SDR family oxidoreductase [Nocardioides sp. GY 10127]TIC84098.1 SDR family oxidoreductase [Nocardioides sp. GY 10127]